ncbi:DUF5719 family protein [Microbacterium sp. P02]|uniref:DUF5719 family protein n=1 Tax=Microbacterium sp. P02 TaxID=3366260 RepID=UPI00366C7A44
MSDRRGLRWTGAGTRVAIGTVVSVAFVVAVATAVAAPWPQVAREPVVLEATPAAAESVVSCTGGILALGRDAASAGSLSVAAEQSVTSGTADPAIVPSESALVVPGVSGGSPLAFAAAPVDGVRTDIAASGSASVDADDLRGLAATACQPPMMESWLVAGATTTGYSDLVLLANPGSVPATVQLTVYGAGDPVVPPGGSDLVVPPGTQIVVPLAGLIVGESSPVVRVSASGAPVRAALQSSLTDTLVPIGLDQVGAVAAPGQTAVIPGVDVTTAPSGGDPATVVRVLAPTADATATITVASADAATASLPPSTVPLTAGHPAEVELPGLALGSYTVTVTAETPVVAAVRQVAGSGEAADYGWYSVAPEVTLPSLFATTSGPDAVLTIANSGDVDATVIVSPRSGSGALSTVTVPARGSSAVPLAGRTVYLLDAGGAPGVHAEVSMAGDGALAAFPVWSADAAARSISVYP